MDFSPLYLPNCRVVPFSRAHLTERYVGWLNDPLVVQYSEQRHRKHDLASCAAYAASFIRSDDLFLAIEAPDLAVGHVGNITIAVDRPNASADISIMIGEPAARGTGIGTAAWCGVIDWLLGSGGLRRVTAGTMALNGPMLALLNKSAMTIEAVRPRAFLLDGVEVDMVLAARFANPELLENQRNGNDPRCS
jgi:RimJ/RimL family protein N-acetyltransferase